MNGSFTLSIKTKFFLTAVLVMALSSATWGGWAWYNERQHLHQRLRDNGQLLLTALRSPIINSLIYEEVGALDDVGALDTFVEEIVNTTEMPTVYAFVTDQSGKVLAHSDYTEYGSMASDPLTLTALHSEKFLTRVARLEPNGENILEMALPLRVAEKSWGTLRIGCSMAPLERQLSALAWQVVSFSGIFFLIGAAVFYVIGVTMSRPLEQLSMAMTGLNHDSLEVTPPPPVSRRDEIGRLQESFRDMVLRLRRSEQERRLAISRLIRAEKLAAIGEIVAGVAHEVNNPLAAMSVSISMMEKKAPPELNRQIGVVRNGLSRIETIVRQLTEFSRAGSLELRAVGSDIFFREAAGFAAMALKKFPVRFVARDGCPPTTLCVDKGKLHQVILNLLLNAVDASSDNGVIELTASVQEGSYRLAVRDEGKGIAPEKQKLIFELFYTTKPAGEGSGIGLAICKNIVEMHRGEIMVVSAPGETTFTVIIPCRGGAADVESETSDCRG